MDFIDEVMFEVKGGRGGDGCVSFRREKFVPKGGPDGGDGGHGGTVVLKTDSSLTTLFHLRHKRVFRAGNGRNGMGKKMHGRNGEGIEIPVPAGTQVFDAIENVRLADLVSSADSLTIAMGGRGGKGNSRFATSTRQAPDFATQGKPGEIRSLRLELSLLADVGLVGLPNAGKSTLLASVSAAKPKIADYPFTTLTPNLGIVPLTEYRQCVMADIPGLIAGAHLGKGLGDRFLRHIERTRILIFLIDSTTENPGSSLEILKEELNQFNEQLLNKPGIVTLTKIDVLNPEQKKKLPVRLGGNPCLHISAVTGEGIPELKKQVLKHLEQLEHA